VPGKSGEPVTNRENALRALRRENPERVPFDLVLCPHHIENVKKKTGTADYAEYFNLPFRYVELEPTKKQIDYTKFYKNLPANAKKLSWNPEWGVYSIPGSVAHFEEMLHPLADFESVDEIRAYPFPDYNESYRWATMETQIEALRASDKVAVAFMQMTIFEVSWYLRGMEQFMVDMAAEPEFASALLDEITAIRIGMAEKYAAAGVDILMLGDDVSTQIDMMLSPALWREMLKPRLAQVIDAARGANNNILIFYHGDGNLQAIIPDLIEIGVDILNPVQPECMNPAEMKKLYGSRLSFWGTVGTQTTLPFGTPAEVEAMVRERVATVGKNGGLVLAPTHVIEPDVPWENIEAFVAAAGKYGKY
jgi:uroporphyrinogen decarboxylase